MPTRFERRIEINGTECLVAFGLSPEKVGAPASSGSQNCSGTNGDCANDNSSDRNGSCLAVIVTHPWGILGGNRHNNVVVATCLYFQRLGITTCRFDFAGSQIGRGYQQVDQLKAVAEGLLQYKEFGSDDDSNNNRERPIMAPTSILLVGYSYGSLITSSASADIPECIGFVSIAPPFSVSHWLLMFHSNYHLERSQQRESLPRLFLIGSNDNFTAEEYFSELLKSKFPTNKCIATTGAVIKDADHFFRHRETDVMNVIGEWLLRIFSNQCEGDLYRLKDIRIGAPLVPPKTNST